MEEDFIKANRVFKLVKKNPGTSMTTLKKNIKGSNTDIIRVVKTFQEWGILEIKEKGPTKRLYLTHEPLPPIKEMSLGEAVKLTTRIQNGHWKVQ
jgi:hypothetical protein